MLKFNFGRAGYMIDRYMCVYIYGIDVDRAGSAFGMSLAAYRLNQVTEAAKGSSHKSLGFLHDPRMVRNQFCYICCFVISRIYKPSV